MLTLECDPSLFNCGLKLYLTGNEKRKRFVEVPVCLSVLSGTPCDASAFSCLSSYLKVAQNAACDTSGRDDTSLKKGFIATVLLPKGLHF